MTNPNLLLTVSFNPDDADVMGIPYEVFVGVGDKRQMYSRAQEATLYDERENEVPPQIAKCSACHDETYFDEMTNYCCVCGARIRRDDD